MAQTLDFDEVLENKVLVGKYQYLVMASIMLADYTNGNLIIFSSIFNPIWKKEFNMTHNYEIKLTIAIYGLGCLFGSLIASQLVYSIGRLNVLSLASLLSFIFGSCYFFIHNQAILDMMRFLIGLSQSMSMALTPMAVSEIWDKKNRGKAVLIETISFTFGKIGACILCVILMESFTQGQWRLIIFLGSFSGLLSAIILKVFTKESPRFLFCRKEYSRAIEIIDYMGYMNHGRKYVPLQDLEQTQLTQWARATFDCALKKDNAKLQDIFKGTLLWTTLQLWLIYSAACFNFFGLKQVSPFIFAEHESSISFILYQTLGELPYVLITVPLIDHPLFGRVRTGIFIMYVGCFLNMMGAILVAYDHIDGFVVLSFFMTVFNKASIVVFITLLTESYSTQYRSYGVPLGSSFGNLLLVIMPFILVTMVNYEGYLPLAFLGLCYSISVIPGFYMKEPKGTNLDSNQQTSNFKNSYQSSQMLTDETSGIIQESFIKQEGNGNDIN